MRGRAAVAALACAAVWPLPGGAAEDAAEAATAVLAVTELPQVTVIGTTPLPGSGVSLRRLAANAQLIDERVLRRQGAGPLTDVLEAEAGGVTLNATQGNPWQAELNVRGFSASPVLGTPQGVSVFVDGVRVNEIFGDTVNWDLIPVSAIASAQLIPGSNPAFGLNTLGAALALQTRRGATAYPLGSGGALTLSAGSFGRRGLGWEAGGVAQEWDWFVTTLDSADGGWAQHNPSRVRQLFAKLGRQSALSDIGLSLQAADNRLEGTQTLPASFPDPRMAYTWPDAARNRLAALAFRGGVILGGGASLNGSAWLRDSRQGSVSSNVEADADEGDAAPAHEDDSRVRQRSRGAGLQYTRSGLLAGWRQQLTVGADALAGRVGYVRTTRDAQLNGDRSTTAFGPVQPQTDAASTVRQFGVFLSDEIEIDGRWTLSLSARHDRARVTLADRSGTAPELDGRHRYAGLNPALGLSFSPRPGFTAYASARQGMRVPTAIELACADPAQPCRLPNNFLADPPLRKVVSRTLELGVRGQEDGAWNWSLAAFRTDLRDDLQFVSSSGTALNAGYFQNLGKTRRQGLELGLGVRQGLLTLALRYSLLNATFRSPFEQSSPANPSADASGAVQVATGNRLPGLPRQALKLRLGLDAGAHWNLGLGLQARSSVFARGDENNANPAVGGYALLRLDSRWVMGRGIALSLRIDNLLNRRHASFGILGTNVFTGTDQGFDRANARRELFRGNGPPRALNLELRYDFT